MYRSTDVHGNPMAVTGTYFEPYNDWPGGGPRPLIVYGPGTQGQGDQCAPSRQFNQGIHWSAVSGPRVQLRGAVRRDDGRARLRHRDDRLPGTRHARPAHLRRPGRRRATPMLDAARAAMKLPGHVAGSPWARGLLGLLARRRRGGVGGRTRVGIRTGPHVVGTYAGAPPADLKELFPYADGSVAGRRRRLRAQLRDDRLSGVRRRDPLEADAAR